MSKQTALQILVESMTTSDVSFYSKEIAIALQMEREQIIRAANNGCKGMCMIDTSRDGKQYYQKTYGGQDE